MKKIWLGYLLVFVLSTACTTQRLQKKTAKALDGSTTGDVTILDHCRKSRKITWEAKVKDTCYEFKATGRAVLRKVEYQVVECY